MEKIKSFKSKKDEYLNFLIFIKDETKINLLKDYFLFLKDNKYY